MRILGAAVVLVALLAAPARAQKLGIQGDRFTIDGQPRFLTFITYFGVMGAPHFANDLHLIKSLGFDGIRIWPNLDTGPQLMNGDGSLRGSELSLLRSILDAAKLERLVVDVTFTYEHIQGMTTASALTGIVNATVALRSYDNLIFDIQNERNVTDRRYMSESDVRAIYLAIKAADPSRLATASEAPEGARLAADRAARNGLDVTAYHDPRGHDWFELEQTRRVVDDMKTNGKPAYLQEPNTTYDDLYYYPKNDQAEYFVRALANAKMAGAAAWCFHTEVGVDFRDPPAYLEDRLRAHPTVEWDFVNSLNQRIVLRTSSGHYLVAESGGGGGVRADRTAAGPGSWEVFSVASLSGGPLVSGDRIGLSTASGTHYLQAANGGGGQLRAPSQTVGAFETFTLEKPGGGVIHHGDKVSLRAGGSNWYVVADSGGGGSVNANSANRGAWETFTLLYVSPHSSEPSSPSGVRDAVKVK